MTSEAPDLPATITLAGREMNRVGLGTNRLTRAPEHISFIKEAVAAGVETIDSAHLYSDGQSERAIGAALSEISERPLIATKGGYGAGHGRPDVLRSEIEQSLERLRTDRIDLYYLHRVDPETPLETSLAAIDDFREAGTIAHIGISEVTVEEIERARQVVPVAAVQNHYNVSEHKHEEVVDYCTEEGIPFVAYFPLKGAAPPALDQIARDRGVTTSQVRLAWLMQRSPVLTPIPGTLSIDHLRENLAAVELRLSDPELEAIANASKARS